jgi:hypothetical protein
MRLSPSFHAGVPSLWMPDRETEPRTSEVRTS